MSNRLGTRVVGAVDTAHYSVEFASGDVGAVSISWGLPPGVALGGDCEQVLGPRGAVTLASPLLLSTREGKAAIEVPQGDPLAEQARQLARCVRTHEEPTNTGENGQRALQIALAAVESIETGQVVSLR